MCWHPWYHTEAKDAAQTSPSAQDRCITESYPTLDISDDKAGTQLPMAAKSLMLVLGRHFLHLLNNLLRGP